MDSGSRIADSGSRIPESKLVPNFSNLNILYITLALDRHIVLAGGGLLLIPRPAALGCAGYVFGHTFFEHFVVFSFFCFIYISAERLCLRRSTNQTQLKNKTK